MLKRLFTARCEPTTLVLQNRGQRIAGLEAIRAIAAMVVVASHAFETSPIDPTMVAPVMVQFAIFSRAAVLIFFLLSGYVIGLTTTHRFSIPASRLYGLKRLARLYPIYIVALGVAWLQAGPASVTEAIGNLLLLPGYESYFGISIKTPATDSALWSLTYEAVYYVLFVALWAWKPRWSVVFGIALFLSLFSVPLRFVPAFLAGWASGFLFWGAGLWLAWNAVRGASARRPLLSWFILLISMNHMNPLVFPAASIFRNKGAWPLVNLTDLAYLPACLLIVCDAAGIVLHGRKLWVSLAFLTPILGLAVWMAAKGPDFHNPAVQLMIGALAAAGAAYWVRPNIANVQWLAWLGACSYGIYAIHYPILWAFVWHFPWNGTMAVRWLGIALFLAVVVTAGYALELMTKKFFLDPLRARK